MRLFYGLTLSLLNGWCQKVDSTNYYYKKMPMNSIRNQICLLVLQMLKTYILQKVFWICGGKYFVFVVGSILYLWWEGNLETLWSPTRVRTVQGYIGDMLQIRLKHSNKVGNIGDMLQIRLKHSNKVNKIVLNNCLRFCSSSENIFMISWPF